MFHLLGQLASSPRKTSSTGFLFLFLPLQGWGKRLSLRFDPPLPSLAALPRWLGPIAAPRTCPGWRRAARPGPGCAEPRRAGEGAPDGGSAGRRTRGAQGGRRRQARGGLKVPGRRGPDDRTTARCGRRKACQSAGEERGQSWLSPVSTPSRDPSAAVEGAPPKLLCQGRVWDGSSFLELLRGQSGGLNVFCSTGLLSSPSVSVIEKRHRSVSGTYCGLQSGEGVNYWSRKHEWGNSQERAGAIVQISKAVKKQC